MTAEVPYPMWVISCPKDGFVATVWEKPGTGCSYFNHCPECGGRRVEVTKVEDDVEHRFHKDRVNSQAEQ